MNYVSKTGDSTKKITLESTNSIGSFGLLSTYNAIGGQIGKVNYYAYYNKRVSDGFRDNSKSDYEAMSAVIQYQISKKFDAYKIKKIDFPNQKKKKKN